MPHLCAAHTRLLMEGTITPLLTYVKNKMQKGPRNDTAKYGGMPVRAASPSGLLGPTPINHRCRDANDDNDDNACYDHPNPPRRRLITAVAVTVTTITNDPKCWISPHRYTSFLFRAPFNCRSSWCSALRFLCWFYSVPRPALVSSLKAVVKPCIESVFYQVIPAKGF